MAEPLTIRNRIIDAFKAVGDAMVDEAGNRLWNKVVFGTPNDLGEAELPGLAVDPGDDKVYENSRTQWKTDKHFTISLSFQWRRDPNGIVDSYDQFEYYLGKLIPAYLANDRLGGAIQIRENGSGPEIEGRSDPRPGGYLLIEVVYRHGRVYPTRTVDTCPDVG